MKEPSAGLFGDMSIELGKVGIWRHPSGLTPEVVAEVEALGYGTIWVGSSPPGDLAFVEHLLDTTEHITVATGIVNVWNDDAATVGASYHRITARHPVASCSASASGTPKRLRITSIRTPRWSRYLDQLDDLKVPAEGRVLAALGPRVLRLSARAGRGRTPLPGHAGAHPSGPADLGDGPLLAPEQKLVLETDPERGPPRAIGRPRVQNPYLSLTNYLSNLRRLGWTDADLADGGSDALIDAARGARRRGGDRPRCHRAPGSGRGPRGHAGPQPRSPARAARAGRPAPAGPSLTTGTRNTHYDRANLGARWLLTGMRGVWAASAPSP